MCKIMTEDSELVRLAKDQQVALMSEIGKVAKATQELKSLASSASVDAREVAENIIAPKVQNIITWVKAVLMLLSGVMTIVGGCAILWLNANYVSLTSNDAAWVIQNRVNESGLKQFQSLELATRLNNQSTEQNRQLIDDMREDIKELRKVLKK